MRKLCRATSKVITLGLVLLVAPLSRSQAQDNPSATPATADIATRVEDLEKEIEHLQKELAAVKKQAGIGAQAPAAPATPATAPAAVPTPAPTQAAVATPSAPAAPAGPTLGSLLGPLSVTGFVDGYYGYDFEHPQAGAPSVLAGNPSTRLAGLRAFDSPQNQFALNMIELILDKPPDTTNSRIGYHLSFGFGNAMNVVNSSDPGGLGFAQHLKEAYGSYLAPIGKGLQIDFGKFVTPMGAEVIESKDNWNYSRGLLFTYAIPFYHFGLRAKYAFSDKYSLTGYATNGWNNIVDNNTGLNYGFTFAWTPTKKWTVTENYCIGPEQFQNISNYRQMEDFVVAYNPTSKLSLMANYDYGRGDRVAAFPNPVWWTGVAGYLKYQFNDKWAYATRYEYYNDHFGFTTGTPQHVNEITETFERRVFGNLISRLEYRRDMSNRPSLFKGLMPVDQQDTVEIGLIYTFDLKELHP
jgi:hypothetical protein